jgi:hypothetical protein
MSYIKVPCAHCKKTFLLVQSEYNSRVKRTKHGRMYCSQACVGKSKEKKEVKDERLNSASARNDRD